MKSLSRLLFIGLFIMPMVIFAKKDKPTKPTKYTKFLPDSVWYDTKGDTINAHGGGILYNDKTYYWYGEKRGKGASEGVTLYTSKDLYNWKYEGMALDTSNVAGSDIEYGCIMERPKVIYNKTTKKYVMWFHLELKGRGYGAARAAVAVSDKPTGPFKYVYSFRPNGNMSRDMNLFVDDDGSAYHIYSSDENMNMRIVKLSDDYSSATAKDSFLFRLQREAPAVFKSNNKYYLITSGCTGWAPNKARVHVADNLFGPWKNVGNPMSGPHADITFYGQSTFVLPVPDKKDAFIYIGDKWNPRNLKNSRYQFLPIEIKDGKVNIAWTEGWDTGVFSK